MNIQTLSTIIVLTENKPGVLYRIANLFLRRKINIESLTVSEIKAKAKSRFTIVVKEDPSLVRKIANQLKRIVEVFEVHVHSDNELFYKEIALIKVGVKNADMLKKIEDLLYQFQANIVYHEGGAVTIQKTGSEQDIAFLQSVLEPFGIKEIVRSGRIALEKGKPHRIGAVSRELRHMSRTTEAIEISSIKKLELMAQAQKGTIPLAQGIPSFFTAEHIQKAAKRAIDTHIVDKYSKGQGIDELRVAISEKLKKENGIYVTPDEIIVTHGGIEALMAIFMSLLNVEDEIIVLTPDYASHITQITIATHGGKPIFVPLVETKSGWKLDSTRLEQAITPHTKAILLCNPCNPTGKVYKKEELKAIARIAKKYNLYIITDEMYEHFVYAGKHISIGSFKEAADRVISVFGFSKSYAMTGWRIGYIAAKKQLIEHIMKIHDSLVTCPTVVSQYAALAALKGPQNVIEKYKQGFLKRRAIVIEELAKTNKLSYTVPEGAYYIFPKFVKTVDDVALAEKLLKKADVAVVPGTPFGKGGENHVRISFGGDEDMLREGLRRFVGYINRNL
ncbi:MAG: acetolactate synthase small subunit [Candidatus Levybacteria bacterium]|nr:acetolactate synthase small subunit [Candidatus Levybacteria bacterium]